MRRVLILDRLKVSRIPGDATFWLLALLFAGLAVQSARLVWAIVTPVTPIGDWRPATAVTMGADVQAAILATVNPFSRAETGAAVLPNDLKLFGVRAAAGGLRGGAIIQLPDGTQVSVAEGEEVMPGVTLAAVGFDFADVVREAGRQRLFLDPDKTAETVNAGTRASVASSDAPPSAAGSLSANQIRAAVSLTPRANGAGISGISVAPGGNSSDFARTGFQAGDVIVSVNGATISAAQDLAQLQKSFVPGASLAIVVERGSRRVPITINLTSDP